MRLQGNSRINLPVKRPDDTSFTGSPVTYLHTFTSRLPFRGAPSTIHRFAPGMRIAIPVLAKLPPFAPERRSRNDDPGIVAQSRTGRRPLHRNERPRGMMTAHNRLMHFHGNYFILTIAVHFHFAEHSARAVHRHRQKLNQTIHVWEPGCVETET